MYTSHNFPHPTTHRYYYYLNYNFLLFSCLVGDDDNCPIKCNMICSPSPPAYHCLPTYCYLVLVPLFYNLTQQKTTSHVLCSRTQEGQDKLLVWYGIAHITKKTFYKLLFLFTASFLLRDFLSKKHSNCELTYSYVHIHKCVHVILNNFINS